MKESTQRAFIALDEWLGMFLSVYLFQSHSPLFWIVCPLWLVAVYGISYPFFWWGHANKQQPTPAQFAVARLTQQVPPKPQASPIAIAAFVDWMAQQPCEAELAGCAPGDPCASCWARGLRDGDVAPKAAA